MPNHQGQLIQYCGDGFLVSFLSSANCVSCALALQKEFRGFHPVLIGLHHVEGVNLVSRVESSAGEIMTPLFACSIDNLPNRTIFYEEALTT